MRKVNWTFIGVFLAIICINLTTPLIANTMMNNYLSKPHCDSESNEPCCNGIDEPNFILDPLEFTEKDISGVYFNIENPKTDYWVRITSLNVILFAIFIVAIICFLLSEDSDYNKLRIFIGMVVVAGIISTITFMVGGMSLPYEFFGMNDSNLYIRNDEKFFELKNIYMYKTYGADDCGGTPIETSLEFPIVSRAYSASYDKREADQCKKIGLTVVANRNFTGVYSRKQVGPWEIELYEPGLDISNVNRNFHLIPECVEKMQEIMAISSGNLVIPISYLVMIVIMVVQLRGTERTLPVEHSNTQPEITKV